MIFLLQKKWEWRKKRIPLPKYKRTKIVEKVRVKKVPGKKLNKQEVKNIERFNKLSLKVLPEKINVIKKSGLSIKEKRELQEEIDDLLSDEELEESPRSGKVRIVKKAGVSLREKRKLAPAKIDVTTDDEETSPKGGKVRIVKKPGIPRREKREGETNDTEFSHEEEQHFAGTDKVRVVKKPGLSIKDKNKLEKERAGHLVNDKNETDDIEVSGRAKTNVKRKSRKDKFIENITLEEDRGMSQRSINNQFGGDYIEEEEEDYYGQYDSQVYIVIFFSSRCTLTCINVRMDLHNACLNTMLVRLYHNKTEICFNVKSSINIFVLVLCTEEQNN